MLIRQISLKRGGNARVVNITEDKEVQEALIQLGVPHPRSVIVLVGGAGGIRWWHKLSVSRAVRIIAGLAEETRSVVVDGGMQAGIMAEIGRQRKQRNLSFPLIGVFSAGLSTKGDPAFVLDPNHTHFLIVPGDDWGDESTWIARIASVIAGDKKSITILVNGGKISERDVEYSLLENRPTFVMRGTGRLADEITATRNIFPVDVSKKTHEILAALKPKLS